MNTFCKSNRCSFLDLAKCRAENATARFVDIFVDGFIVFFICCIPFDEVQTLSFF